MPEQRSNGSIRYRDTSFRLSKTEAGAHTASPAETYRHVERYFERLGVTRIADITGLDRIGIPVVNAVRPDFTGYAVAHGKGVTTDAAKISACMESIERYHGVSAELPVIEGTYDEVRESYPVPRIEDLALSKHSLFHSRIRERWTLGWDIMNQEETAVPLPLVLLPMDHTATDLRSFQSSSNGLAASLHFLAAVRQALLELIERDAVTCHQAAARAEGSYVFPLRLVDSGTVTHETAAGLIERIESKGIAVALFDCETDTAVPTYNCFLLDAKEPEFGVCHGMGASLDPGEAMVRALTEAVQARAVFESGVRDSFLHDQFTAHKASDPETLWDSLKDGFTRVDGSERVSDSTDSFEGDINACLDRLRKVGIERVIVFDLTREGFDLSAVKIVVPGLEGYMLPYYAPGDRAKAYLEGRKTVRETA